MSGLVKHFQNDMKNIPQLSNNWGSMINLLDKVLVEGFNFVPVISVVKSSSDAITATINLGSGHGFIDRQVVRIAGSTNGWDGDYKVLSANTDSVVVECAATNPIAINGTASCSTAPLDFEIVFRTPAGSTEPKRAYRSKDPESLGLILLVHDFCVSGAAASGAKFAKVGVVSSMSDIDTITGTQMPYDSSNPSANWGWDGSYHGWAKWYYAVAHTSYRNAVQTDSASPSYIGGAYSLAGSSDQGFIVSINIGLHNWGTTWGAYGFTEFYDESLKNKNALLICAGIPNKYAQNANHTILARGGIVPFGSGDTIGSSAGQMKGLIWLNESGETVASTLLRPPYLDVQNNNLIVSDMLVIDSSGVTRGVVPFVKTTTVANDLSQIDQDMGKYKNFSSMWADSIGSSTRYCLMLERS